MGMDKQIKKKKWPPRKIAALVCAVAFIAFAVYVFAFKFRTSSLNVETDRLTISTVTKGPFQEFTAVMGNVVPRYQYFLSALEGGSVEQLYIEAGTMVKKGDPILRLSNTNTNLDIMWREADFFQASNNLRSTRLAMEQYKMSLRKELNDVENLLQQEKRKFDRYAEMFKNDLLSQHEFEVEKDQYEYLVRKKDITIESQKKDLEFRETQLQALEGSVGRLQESLDTLKKKLENLVVRAPINGYLTALDAEIGQIKASGARLGQIDVLEDFKVRARIDEHYLPRIETGKKGNFELAGLKGSLVVSKVFPQVTEGQFEIDLDFEGTKPPGITRGQTFHINLNLSDITEAVLLSKGGFYPSTGGNWAYIVDKSGKYAFKRDIKLGRQNTQEYEVLEGLDPGERVITSSYESFGNIDRLVFK
jgi:HlyD family secretion protein